MLARQRAQVNWLASVLPRFFSNIAGTCRNEDCKIDNGVLLENHENLDEQSKHRNVAGGYSTVNNNIVANLVDNKLMVPSRNKGLVNDNLYFDDEECKPPRALDICTNEEDVSHIGETISPTFNFARYANKSHTIQQLVKLGVHLYKLERNRKAMELIFKADFEKDMKPYLEFLVNCGVPPENLGNFITRNPLIFKEDMDDLYTRIRYLRAHDFDINMIQRIVAGNPKWLSCSTKQIDEVLGYFQHTFKLTGQEVRAFVMKEPNVVSVKLHWLQENTFAIKEEMGFSPYEMKSILLKLPKLWIQSRLRIVDTFDYAHNVMKLPHELIAKEPEILSCRKLRLEQRHRFLVELKRAQYDPTKPLYVSPKTLVIGTDIDFCQNIAKASIDTYNLFLKTF